MGLTPDLVRARSSMRGEPDWLLGLRLDALRHFEARPMPSWARDLPAIDIGAGDGGDLGGRAGVGAIPTGSRTGGETPDDAEAAAERSRENLERLGVVFCDLDTAVREYPELVRPHLATIIPIHDHKFSALNASVWSGGSFIHVPPGVEVAQPLEDRVRARDRRMGPFERTLIVAGEGSRVHYIEGCSAPVYSSASLRSAAVEVVVGPSARVTYTTIQNWSSNVVNLVTKRAAVGAEGRMEWIDGNIGSRLTMTYPGVWLVGPKASGEVRSVAYAGRGQHQDTGARMVHMAPETTSTVVSRAVTRDGGRSSHRGLIRVAGDANGCASRVRCDALVLDDRSMADAYPSMEIEAPDARIGHEAEVSTVTDEQLFYLMSRGLAEQQAVAMVVNGFIEPITRSLPIEYAVEWSRLIEAQMEGSIG